MIVSHGDYNLKDGMYTVPEKTLILQTAELGNVTCVDFDNEFAKLFIDGTNIALTTNTLFGLYGSRAENMPEALARVIKDRYKYFRGYFPTEETVNKGLFYGDTEIGLRDVSEPDSVLPHKFAWGIYKLDHTNKFIRLESIAGENVDKKFKEGTTVAEISDLLNSDFPSNYNIFFFSSCSVVAEEDEDEFILPLYSRAANVLGKPFGGFSKEDIPPALNFIATKSRSSKNPFFSGKTHKQQLPLVYLPEEAEPTSRNRMRELGIVGEYNKPPSQVQVLSHKADGSTEIPFDTGSYESREEGFEALKRFVPPLLLQPDSNNTIAVYYRSSIDHIGHQYFSPSHFIQHMDSILNNPPAPVVKSGGQGGGKRGKRRKTRKAKKTRRTRH